MAPARLSDVLASGITRVAVSGAVTTAGDPAPAAKELLDIIATATTKLGEG